MPTFKIQHITRYNYDRPVKESVSQIKIFPIEDVNQRLVTFDLQISGNPDVLTFTDYFGNKTGDFSLLPPHNDLTIDSRFVVHTKDDWSEPLNVTITLQDVTDGIKDDIRLIWLSEPEKIQSQHIIEQLLFETEITHKPVVEISKACCNYIYKNFAYKKGITTVETTIDEILDHKSGVCQDFAHVLLQMLRTIGIPARYVSGYICPNKSGMRGEGATHAWVEYYLPGTGWVGLDPTNNVFAGPYH
ncbi:MAG: transglutaminase family protein, partial [Chitinophagaceae bacterium]|nr:transglutaminase family protein [Chitinophagaceae bacterium]